jgi:hypothetical protein
MSDTGSFVTSPGAAGQRANSRETPEGKDRFEHNAPQRGLQTSTIVLPNEDEADFNELRARLTTDLCPVGEVEEMLADEIAICTWRTRRTVRIERDLLAWHTGEAARNREQSKTRVDREDTDFARAVNRAFGTSDALRTLKSYETAIKREWTSALHEIERLQERRLTGSLTGPPAARVTVDSSPSGSCQPICAGPLPPAPAVAAPGSAADHPTAARPLPSGNAEPDHAPATQGGGAAAKDNTGRFPRSLLHAGESWPAVARLLRSGQHLRRHQSPSAEVVGENVRPQGTGR